MKSVPRMSICFLCLNSCDGDGKTEKGIGEISQKFLNFTETQLELPLKELFLDEGQLENVICGGCNDVVCMICSLYDDLCSVQERLKEKVDQLLDLLERSSNKKCNDSGDSTQVGMGIRGKCHYKKVVEKRIQLKQHCKNYRQATGKSDRGPEDLSEDEDNHKDPQFDDSEGRVDVKSELDSDENEDEEIANDFIGFQDEMKAGTEAMERGLNGSDASSNSNAESSGAPEEDDEKEDFSANNSDSDWKGDSETENDDDTPSNDTETDNGDDNFIKDKSTAKKTKKEPPKVKRIVKNVRSTETKLLVNGDLGDSIYKCDKCDKLYVSKGFLDRHLRMEHGLGKSRHITCNLCGKEFSQERSLMRHKDSKHNGNIETEVIYHTCKKCDQSFRRKGCLDKHMFKIHGIGSLKSFIYNCNLCEKGFNIKGSLTRHQRWSHKITSTRTKTKFFCETCQNYFKTSKSLREHKQRAHIEELNLPSPSTPPSPKKSFKCKILKSSKSLRKHKQRAHEKLNLPSTSTSAPPPPDKVCLDKPKFRRNGIGSKKSFIYNCNLCEKGFNLKGNFTRHQRLNHKITPTKTETPFFCDTCKNFYKTSKSLREHKQRAHGKQLNLRSTPEKPYKCEICSYDSNTYYGLVRHVNKKHGIERKLVSKPVNCKICLETCKDNYSLERHVNLVHQAKMEVPCPNCSMTFDTRRQLIHHKYTVHKKDEITVSFMKRLESAKGNINDEVKINCVVCKEEFSSWEVLRGHLRIHENEILLGDKSLRCFKCDKLFAYEQTIWAHLRSSKRHDYTSIEFPCDHADHLGYSQWVFKDPTELESHFKEEHGDCGVLKCEQCGWPFLDKNMLDMHRLLHIPRINKKYQCPMCSNTFLHQDSLQGHYNPVHGVSLKLFRCEVCTWGFATKRGLAGHVKTHEAPTVTHDFLCSTCPRSFKTAIQLRDHVRHIHVTKQCPDCGILVQRSRYSRHRRIKHSQSQKGHLCTLCGMAFRESSGLKSHMAFHGEYHYNCQYCGKGCVTGWYLRKHIRKVHKDQVVGDEGQSETRKPGNGEVV